ncbi:hypothetical protein pdam_00003096 [Pocillopora damicornis]|uniref:Leucine-rich repeat-containing protein 34 n=1 Tax=Pocillopora damicornis TaxID=46731 RepID=A0A3M6T9S6_POCDA|nr:hypothetical protein pdam_00003096 [Pocillopora damicornis]
MGDAASTKEDYLKVCAELEKEPDTGILAVLNSAVDDSFLDPIIEFDLFLHGNKRNERNEMYRRRLTDEDASILYKTLRSNTFETVCLQWLVLSYNDIGPAGGEAIAKGLQVNETLGKLRLNGNKIKNKGGMAIAGALQVNTMLEELDLGETDQEIESIIAMTTVLNLNNTLKSVNLNRPVLFTRQEETTVHVAKMLKVNSNTPLEVLNLAYNRIEDDGAIALADALAAYNTNLTTNNIAGDGLCAVAKAMRSNGALHAVYIWGNKLEEPACRAFQDLLDGPVPRLDPSNTDVEPYIVDGVVYLARLSSPF